MEGGGRVDVELPVNRKVLWDRGADKIQLNKPNSPESWSCKAPLYLTVMWTGVRPACPSQHHSAHIKTQSPDPFFKLYHQPGDVFSRAAP